MLGRCVTGQGSNDDVSNFPEVNVNLTLIYSLSHSGDPNPYCFSISKVLAPNKRISVSCFDSFPHDITSP